MFHNGMSNNEQDYEMCFRVENVVLPKNGYFGVTAATGGLAGMFIKLFTKFTPRFLKNLSFGLLIML